MSAFYSNVSGIETKTKPYGNAGGIWTPGKQAYGNVNGIWTQGFNALSVLSARGYGSTYQKSHINGDGSGYFVSDYGPGGTILSILFTFADPITVSPNDVIAGLNLWYTAHYLNYFYLRIDNFSDGKLLGQTDTVAATSAQSASVQITANKISGAITTSSLYLGAYMNMRSSNAADTLGFNSGGLSFLGVPITSISTVANGAN